MPRTVIVINEPDLKIPGESKPTEFSRQSNEVCNKMSLDLAHRAIVSAIDGMLDAEKDTHGRFASWPFMKAQSASGSWCQVKPCQFHRHLLLWCVHRDPAAHGVRNGV